MLPDNHDGYYRLPGDTNGIEFDPPDMDSVTNAYRDTVRRLSLAIRAIVRDRDPLCNGHGTANPVTGQCDDCISGWSGKQCEIPRYPEFANTKFSFPPTTLPTVSPSDSPTKAPTPGPSKGPTKQPPTRQPSTSYPTRLPTTPYPTKWRSIYDTNRPTSQKPSRNPIVPKPRRQGRL
jgi:hypothetical protein